jgi:hypothetical protein
LAARLSLLEDNDFGGSESEIVFTKDVSIGFRFHQADVDIRASCDIGDGIILGMFYIFFLNLSEWRRFAMRPSGALRSDDTSRREFINGSAPDG